MLVEGAPEHDHDVTLDAHDALGESLAAAQLATLDRPGLIALVERTAGTRDVDSLTREQVQGVYDALEPLIETRIRPAA